jgi:alkylated DNA repair dioxygenase AlkB
LTQPDLFLSDPVLPEGMRYREEFLDPLEHDDLLTHIRTLPFKEFEFLGFLGKRRTVSFGWKYDYGQKAIERVDDMPAFLHEPRARAATFADIAPESLQQCLINEYAPGAGIGWHRDKPQFGDVIGISMISPAPFRLRRKKGEGWERITLEVQPRSIYLLRGPSRTEWEHSIPPVDAARYSITFRNLRDSQP